MYFGVTYASSVVKIHNEENTVNASKFNCLCCNVWQLSRQRNVCLCTVNGAEQLWAARQTAAQLLQDLR